MIRPEDWRPADGLTLEPNALIAVKEQVRCLALTAGPGAGKTEMLAQRAVFLLRTGFCRYPKRILAISFKVDASRNLKERVKRRCGTSLSARFDSYTFHAFAKRIIDRFRPVLVGPDALDVDYTIGELNIPYRQIKFDELVPLAIKILQTSILVLNAVRQTYSDVFLDEFQDCTSQQYELIRIAFQGTTVRLTAVGDTKQKIMGWAGALEGIFISLAKDFEAVSLNLYRNFRSQPRLLRMQNAIIKVLDPKSVMSNELMKGDDGIIEVQTFDNSQQEAEYLAVQINRWIKDDGLPYSEIAVLVSKQANLYAELLMTELNKRDIPFRNDQDLQDFSVEPASRLIIDYLLVLFGNREPDAYNRLMEQVTDSAIYEHAKSNLRNDWSRFIKTEREKVELSELLDGSFDSRWAYVVSFLGEFGEERLASLSADYESLARRNEVIENIQRRLRDIMDVEPDLVKALKILTDDCAVRIMTIHKSKGLEFDSVVILAVEKETFWGKQDDELCAFFVATSRAKRRLVLTFSETRPRPINFQKRWEESRTLHKDFIRYAEPFCSPSL